MTSSKEAKQSPPAEAQPHSKAGNLQKEKKWTEFARNNLLSPNVQIFVLSLVYFDMLIATTQAADKNDTTTYHFEPLRAVILYIHAIELIAQMIIFNTRFLEQWGLMLDTILIGSRLAGTYSTPLIGFLRVWRLLPLIETFLAIETTKHVETQRELSRQLRAVEEFKKQTTMLESDLKQERDLRKQNEDMTKEWREEIETLGEALKIAAMDVAAIQGEEIELEDLVFDAPFADERGIGEIRGLTIRSISPVVE
jgi:hypothetical protein